MSDELKPCPFCGGEATEGPVSVNGKPSGDIGWVGCVPCGVFVNYTHSESGRREAMRAWNTRVAVTDEQFAIAVHDGRAWQVVRECGQPRGFIPCDSDSFGSMSFAELWCEHCDIELDQEWQFCPNCGAKVVG